MKTANEVRMLRELVYHFLTLEASDKNEASPSTGNCAPCFFCKKPLLESVSTAFGHHSHQKIDGAITIHHRNGNHDDNRPANRKLAHRTCHRSFHMKQLHKNGTFRRARLAKKEAR